jgi:putative oxidoreductase
LAVALGRLLRRTLIGGLFVGHGTQKLFGWFEGGGVEGTAQSFDSIGLRPPRRNTVAAGLAETGGGSFLAVGVATPAAAALLSGVMLTAIHKVHWKNGVWNAKGGYEYNAVLIANLFDLVEDGPGPWSLDALLGIEKRGTRWGIAALGAGAAGAALAIGSSKRTDRKASDEPMRAEAEYQKGLEEEPASGDPSRTA